MSRITVLRGIRQCLFPSCSHVSGVNPLDGTKLFGHSFRFHRGILASPSRRRGLGKGTAFEFLSPVVLSKSSRCSLGSQKTPSLRFAIRPELAPRSVARTLREVDSPAPSASAADCNTAR